MAARKRGCAEALPPDPRRKKPDRADACGVWDRNSEEPAGARWRCVYGSLRAMPGDFHHHLLGMPRSAAYRRSFSSLVARRASPAHAQQNQLFFNGLVGLNSGEVVVRSIHKDDLHTD